MMSVNIVAGKKIKLQINIISVCYHESSHEYIIEFIFSMPAAVWLSSQLAEDLQSIQVIILRVNTSLLM